MDKKTCLQIITIVLAGKRGADALQKNLIGPGKCPTLGDSIGSKCRKKNYKP